MRPPSSRTAPGQKISIYQDNRYGASGGAPVIIPKVYNGKNRTFWFVTWEANKFGDPNVGTNTSTVPAREDARSGDFSELLGSGANYQIYDPAHHQGRGERDVHPRPPFPDNIIPASRLDPVG